jgi:SAM-dependent methyltransferase
MVDAMEKWPGSEEPNETGFALANGTNIPMFDVISRDPERAKHMAAAMAFMHAGPGYNVRHVLEHFDRGTAAEGVLVDIGGGTGGVAFEIARFFPGIRCIVQDLPEVIQGTEVPEDLNNRRVQFMEHDFFEEQPVKGADVYFLRWILHDWSDKYAVKILRNLIPALRTGSRILVSELCLPSPCVLSPYKERSAR